METQNIINIVLVALCVFAIGLAVFGMGSRASVTGAQIFPTDITFTTEGGGFPPLFAGAISMGTGILTPDAIALGGISFNSNTAESFNIDFEGGTYQEGIANSDVDIVNQDVAKWLIQISGRDELTPNPYAPGTFDIFNLRIYDELTGLAEINAVYGLNMVGYTEYGDTIDSTSAPDTFNEVVPFDTIVTRDYVVEGALDLVNLGFGPGRHATISIEVVDADASLAIVEETIQVLVTPA